MVAVNIVFRTSLFFLCTVLAMFYISPAIAQSENLNDCDRLAATPSDPNVSSWGVALSNIDPVVAIPACKSAIESDPLNPRYAFQLSRALLAAKRYRDAQEYAEVAILDGYPIANVILGYLAATGYSGRKDEEVATQYYTKAAKEGLPLAAIALAKRYNQGVGVQVDKSRVSYWLNKAAETKSPLAFYDLGHIYLNGSPGEKDLTKARAFFEKASNLGLPDALNSLGFMYMKGIGVPRDIQRASNIFERCIEHRIPLCHLNYGVINSAYGNNLADFKKAEKHLRLALKQGIAFADISLALLLRDEGQLDAKPEEIVSLFRSASKRGDVLGTLNLGLLMLEGRGIKSDPNKGIELLKKAAQLKSPDAYQALARVYEKGTGVKVDHKAALNWYRLAGEAGNRFSKYTWARKIIEGINVTPDVEKGLDALHELAQAEYSFAQWYLGHYFADEKRPPDYAKAAKWYRRASEQGDNSAKSRLGKMLVQGKGVNRNIDAGLKLMTKAAEAGGRIEQSALGMVLLDLDKISTGLDWLRKAAKQGNERDQATLGLKLIEFKLDPGDTEEAVGWLRKAAKSGYAYAQWNLGLLYENGHVVTRDYDAALKWMKRAAEQGVNFANSRLGYYYSNGLVTQINHKEAVKWFRRSAKTGDPYSLFMLGMLHQNGLGTKKDISKAREFYEKAAAKNEPMSIAALASLNSTGEIKDASFRTSADLIKKAVQLSENLGPQFADKKAFVLERAGIFSNIRGRYAEGENYYKRALKIREITSGKESAEYADALSGYASLLQQSGRLSQADKLFKRSLKILNSAEGNHTTKIAGTRYDYALMKETAGDYEGAKILFQKIRNVLRFAFGVDTKTTEALIDGNIGRIETALGNYEEAMGSFEAALPILKSTDQPNEPRFLRLGADYAQLLVRLKRFKEAETIYQDIYRRVKELGMLDHPLVSVAAIDFARSLQEVGKTAEALDLLNQLVEVSNRRLTRQSKESLSQHSAERNITKTSLVSQIDLLLDSRFQASGDEGQQRVALSFRISQLLQTASAGDAISQMGARFARDDDALSSLIRERQDLLVKWRGLDATSVAALTQSGKAGKQVKSAFIQTQLRKLEADIEKLDTKLLADFPQYYQLASARPIEINQAQVMLQPDEALLTYVLGETVSYIFVIRGSTSAFHRIELKGSEVAAAVKELRGSLDSKGVTKLSEVKPFNTTKAYELYKKLFAPAVKYLDGVRHVMVVPDGALQSLPLGVLVTEKPQGSFTDFSGYRQVPWLAKKYALSVLPSVSSLKALRMFAKMGRSTEPFKGFGDPILDGTTNSRGSVEPAALFSRGPIVDVKKLKELDRLPDTANELRAIAITLGVDEQSLYLGERATESQVKDMDLSNTRIVSFATHGLIAGQWKGLQEPGLVLTPPTKGTQKDDGYLTASEIAQLKLNADWVILSACNTASSDGKPGAEGLSGLAKAFFYAGSRALLVSHWPVLSSAATQLTTRMLKEAKGKTIGRAEALRRSMIALMNDTKVNYLAHPMFWAPFSVVGEGK
jgi:TPR repeat protein/CHAT domain-containing protein